MPMLRCAATLLVRCVAGEDLEALAMHSEVSALSTVAGYSQQCSGKIRPLAFGESFGDRTSLQGAAAHLVKEAARPVILVALCWRRAIPRRCVRHVKLFTSLRCRPFIGRVPFARGHHWQKLLGAKL